MSDLKGVRGNHRERGRGLIGEVFQERTIICIEK
jgi:hypothetical protein